MNDLNIGIIGFGLVGKRHAIAIKKTNGLILSDIINWMYPVLNLNESQKEFYDAAPLPISLEQVFPSSEEKDSWIASWENSIIE